MHPLRNAHDNHRPEQSPCALRREVPLVATADVHTMAQTREQLGSFACTSPPRRPRVHLQCVDLITRNSRAKQDASGRGRAKPSMWQGIKICFSRFCDGWLPGWPPTAGWGEAVGWASAHQGQPEAGWMGCRQRLTEKGSTRPGRGACCQRTSSQRCC